MEQALSGPDTDAYFVIHQERRVGFIRVDRSDASVYTLADICILPEYQEKGLGRQALCLLDALYPLAQGWSLTSFAEDLHAGRLFEKQGYACIGPVQGTPAQPSLLFSVKLPRSAFRIRRMQANDFEPVRALYRQVQAMHTARLSHIYNDVEIFDQAFFSSLLAEDGVCLVAEQDGKAIGLCVLQWKHAPDFPLFKPRTYAFIDDLCVDECYRRQGVGRLLMLSAMQYARACGSASLELNVWGFNEDAQRFYASLGFHCMRMQLEKTL